MPQAHNLQPVYDEYGELIGYLETSSRTEKIRVLDADGQQIATTHSLTAGKRHLLSSAFNNKLYFSKARARR